MLDSGNFYSMVSRPFDRPETGKIAVKVFKYNGYYKSRRVREQLDEYFGDSQ